MDYFEGYRSQLRQGPLLRTLPGAVRLDDLRRVHHLVQESAGRGPQINAFNLLSEGRAFDLRGAELSISDKLTILSGQDCNAHPDADVYYPDTADLYVDFASDSPIRKLGRLVLWHCECLYYQLFGQRIGERVELLKQKWAALPDRSCSTAR